MQFIKFYLFLILSLIISINAYAKCDKPCEKKRDGIIIEPGTKVNWRLDKPGLHSHYDCPKESGHWHYDILNQNPNTCDCHANKSGRQYVCDTITPVGYNTIEWDNKLDSF